MKKRLCKSGRVLFVMLFLSLGVLAYGKTASAAVSAAYDKFEIGNLLEGGFVASNANVTMTKNEIANGVLFSGKNADLTNCVFSFTKEFDFDQKAPMWLMVDGLVEKRKTATIEFYKDDETKSFVSVTLGQQKKEYKWTTVKTNSADMQTANLQGKHKISFKVVGSDATDFTYLLRSIEFIQNDLPIVDLSIDETKGSIDMMNNDQEHDTECYGDASIKVPDGYKSEYSDATYSSATYPMEYIRGRGNSTWSADKRPYKVKLKDKVDLFGMGASKHWILLANYYDITMIRNKFTYWLGSQLKMEFTPQCVFVNVVMNHKYMGSYYLCEQVRVGKSRVDIDDLEDNKDTKKATDLPTISGGYLLGMSPYGNGEEVSFSTTQGNSYQIESPSFEGYTNEAQVKYISDYMQKTEDAIYGTDFKDKEGKSYSDYLDVDSAIDYYWIQEISLNGDAYGSPSTYLYKKRNGKLFWGPLWDFDYVAWGSTEYTQNQVEGFQQNTRTWFARLIQDPVFYEKLKARWPAIREKLLEASKDGGQIDKYGTQMEVSQKYNYDVWTMFSSSWGDGEPLVLTLKYGAEVQRLKSWVNARVKWIDENLSSVKPEMYTVVFSVDGKVCLDYQIPGGGTLDKFPEAPTKKGYIFQGWYAKRLLDGKWQEFKVEENQEIKGNISIYAKWVKESAAYKPTKLYFSQEEYYLFPEEYREVVLGCIPFNGIIGSVTYTSSDEEIVSIKENRFCSGTKVGVATVVAKTKNGIIATCKVHVVNQAIPSINSFEAPKNISLKVGQYQRIPLIISPKESNAYGFYYGSDDTAVVEVDSYGYVHAKKAGIVNIAIYNADCSVMKFTKITVTDAGAVEVGTVLQVNNLKYCVTKIGTLKEVICSGIVKNAANAVIPNSVVYKGINYSVVGIGAGAFKNNKAIKKVVVGGNVTTIERQAFEGCSKLTTLKLQTKKLSKVGSNVIKGTSKKLKIVSPKGKKDSYAKLFKKKG